MAPESIDGCVITHEHGDHAGCSFDFAACHKVLVILTAGTRRALKAEGKMLDGVRVQLVRGEHKFSVGGIEVNPFTVPHDAAEPVQYVVLLRVTVNTTVPALIELAGRVEGTLTST